VAKRRLPKRLFPKQYQADFIKTKRIDHNVAGAYNAQRSRATVGRTTNTEHDFESNWHEPVPRTRSLTTFDPENLEYIRSERGKAVDRMREEMDREVMELIELVKGDGSWYDVWKTRKDTQPLSIRYSCIVLDEVKVSGYRLLCFYNRKQYLYAQEYEGQRLVSRIYDGSSSDAVQKYKVNKSALGWASIEKISTS
jgi:hypothetical protein